MRGSTASLSSRSRYRTNATLNVLVEKRRLDRTETFKSGRLFDVNTYQLPAPSGFVDYPTEGVTDTEFPMTLILRYCTWIKRTDLVPYADCAGHSSFLAKN